MLQALWKSDDPIPTEIPNTNQSTSLESLSKPISTDDLHDVLAEKIQSHCMNRRFLVK